MAADPTKLNDLEMLSLLALGLTAYMQRVDAGEKDPFLYPDALICGFNQLLIICALQDVPRAQRPASIPVFVATWATLPLSEWAVKLDIPVVVFAVGDRLLDPECDGRPTAFYAEGLAEGKQCLQQLVKRLSPIGQLNQRRSHKFWDFTIIQSKPKSILWKPINLTYLQMLQFLKVPADSQA